MKLVFFGYVYISTILKAIKCKRLIWLIAVYTLLLSASYFLLGSFKVYIKDWDVLSKSGILIL